MAIVPSGIDCFSIYYYCCVFLIKVMDVLHASHQRDIGNIMPIILAYYNRLLGLISKIVLTQEPS